MGAAKGYAGACVMTRLYRLDCDAAQIALSFDAVAGDDPWAGGYAAPGRFAPVVTAGREYVAGPRVRTGSAAPVRPRITPRLWGVMPPPSASDPERRIASLRNPQSPFWIGNLRNSEFRCLVPATAFMEWGSGTDYEGRRLKHWFALEEAGIFAMAAVWKDADIPAFALLTRQARGRAAQTGARSMPVIIAPGSRECAQWLHGEWGAAARVIDAPTPQHLIEITV